MNTDQQHVIGIIVRMFLQKYNYLKPPDIDDFFYNGKNS